MATAAKKGTGKFDYSTIGAPITVGDRTIRAIARVRGVRGTVSGKAADALAGAGRAGSRPSGHRERGGGGGTGVGAGAFVHVAPVEFIVRDRDGTRHSIAVTDPTGQAIRGMIRGALAIGAVCWILIRLARALHYHRADDGSTDPRQESTTGSAHE